jgi:GT2 family glycosyltransferase
LFEKKVTFDEDFSWHNYDTSFCLRAKQAGLKIGVWPIFCIHHGLGEWQNEIEWQKADKKFKEKYVLG